MAQQVQPHILKKFDIVQKLGKGAYGVVWKAIDKQNKQVLAIKKVFDAFQNSTDAQRTFREVIFLQQLSGHRNIIQLRYLMRAENNKDIYLIFDFMQTDLHAVIRVGILEEVHKKYIMYQILKAIKYMHSGQLIHRDLKPSNILLDSDCVVKLADFGLARSVAHVETTQQLVMTEYVATRWYRAPEILLGSSKYSKAVDIWSIGCILGQIYLGKTIFAGNSTLNQIQKILELVGKPTSQDIDSMQSVMGRQCINQISIPKKKTFSSSLPHANNHIHDLLQKMLYFNPKNRISVDQALQHPFFRDFHSKDQQLNFDGIIRTPIDDNTKYSIKDYRDALYSLIKKSKQKSTKRTTIDTLSSIQTLTHLMYHQPTNNDFKINEIAEKQLIKQKNSNKQNNKYIAKHHNKEIFYQHINSKKSEQLRYRQDRNNSHNNNNRHNNNNNNSINNNNIINNNNMNNRRKNKYESLQKKQINKENINQSYLHQYSRDKHNQKSIWNNKPKIKPNLNDSKIVQRPLHSNYIRKKY